MNLTFQSKHHSHILTVLNFHLHRISCVKVFKNGPTNRIQKHISIYL